MRPFHLFFPVQAGDSIDQKTYLHVQNVSPEIRWGMTLSRGLLDKLNAALFDRRIADGFQLLARADKELEALQPVDPHAAAYLLCIAQWVDLGFRSIDYLNGIAARFVDVRRGQMSICDYLYLRMVEGHLAFLAEDAEQAISIFSFVLQTETTIMEPYLVVVAHFWKCRAHRRQGEYEPALHHIREAKRLAREMKAAKLVAVTNIHESWLLFQRGERREAMRLLDLAEAELKSTGHALSLGNIESARGRFVRRSGEYTKALAHFEKAVAIYSGAFPEHPNLARALVNAAYVKRLLALELLHRSKSGKARGADHARYLEICQDALQDHILMARSRILQATVQNERVEEQVGESTDLSLHGHLARTYSEEAIALARLTQNNRLLAGASIARSSVAANEFFQDWETAKTFAALAGELLGKDDLDHLSQELIVLKARIIRATGVDEMLRAWSEGITGEKTFQQITEEFAELVIPKVWIREDKKVSRVAERLSISPKKVRRILANVNLLKRG